MKSFLSIVALSALVLQGANAALDPIVIKVRIYSIPTPGNPSNFYPRDPNSSSKLMVLNSSSRV